MKNLFLLLFIVIFVGSCTKDNADPIIEINQIVDHKIIFSGLDDSIVYFYNSDRQLLKVDQIISPDTIKSYSIVYHKQSIEGWNGIYYLDGNGKIISFYSNESDNYSTTNYIYQDEFIVQKKVTKDGKLTDDHYFFYKNDVRIKDSIFSVNSNGENSFWMNEYFYSDTLMPDFIIDRSGFYELSKASKYLHTYAIGYSIEDGNLKPELSFKPRYMMSDYSIITYQDWIDLDNNEIITTSQSAYYLQIGL